MDERIEAITLCRHKDRIIVHYEHTYDDKYGTVLYRTGEIDKDDIENCYVGALKYFFDNSEVWNG